MHFSNLNYFINVKKKTNKIEKNIILLLVLFIGVSSKVFFSYEEVLNKVVKDAENLNNIMMKNKEYKKSAKYMIDNTYLLFNILSSNYINGQINENQKESYLLINGDEKLINDIIQDLSSLEQLKVKNVEFYIKGSGLKEAKLTFGEYINEE